MSNRRNYYRILHVQPDAPTPVIRSSYRAIMQKMKQHPDLGGDHAKATIINEAYAVLTNQEKRANYDNELMQHHSKSSLGGKQFHQRTDQTTAEKEHQTEPKIKKNRNKVNSHCVFCKTPHKHLPPQQLEATCARCDSPLSEASPMELEQSCRRAIMRISKDEVIGIYTAWPQTRKPVRLQDMSPNGLSFITTEAVAKTKIIKIASDLLHAVAEVTSCQSTHEFGSSAFSIGVRFLTLRFQQSKGTFILERA